MESLLAGTLKSCGYHVFSTKEYMSRVRGGMNSTEIRVSPDRVRAFVDRIDILACLNPGGVSRLRERVRKETLILGSEEVISEEERKLGDFVAVPWKEIAEELGKDYYANTVATGVLLGLLEVDKDQAAASVAGFFSGREDKIRDDNVKALERGYRIGSELREKRGFSLARKPDPEVREEALMNGTQGIGLGAIAGGCNFLSFYPMSPSTGVGVFLAQHADDFKIEVEQAEDEISAINMVLGSWYAGGRAMVTTSGGGFALMIEGLSLAGMLETPAVIHIGQRPGPATGLPTRTEQGELLFALFAGHGEFPRIIFAPGTIEEAFRLTRKAFNLAAACQVPVIILSDQYLLDSQYDLPPLDLSGFTVEKRIVKTEKDYRRYALTPDGISPRGIPGYGEGLVAVDSDEHDETGHITEDFAVRTEMVNKRLKKLDLLKKEVEEPEFSGDENYRTLLLGWGSTHYMIRESLEEIGEEGIGYLHFSQVYPIWPKTAEFMAKARRTVVIENNATSQFGRLIRMSTGREPDGKILKYNGMPFSTEELVSAITKEVSR